MQKYADVCCLLFQALATFKERRMQKYADVCCLLFQALATFKELLFKALL
jgi:hypothetical protein